MVIDTSALVAMLREEPAAAILHSLLAADPTRLLSAANLLETSIVVEGRYGEAGGRELDLLIHKAKVQVVAVTPEQIELARDAFRRFGKGRHPAALNFGDCFAYALSRFSGEPLLFIGEDFPKTDLTLASPTKA